MIDIPAKFNFEIHERQCGNVQNTCNNIMRTHRGVQRQELFQIFVYLFIHNFCSKTLKEEIKGNEENEEGFQENKKEFYTPEQEKIAWSEIQRRTFENYPSIMSGDKVYSKKYGVNFFSNNYVTRNSHIHQIISDNMLDYYYNSYSSIIQESDRARHQSGGSDIFTKLQRDSNSLFKMYSEVDNCITTLGSDATINEKLLTLQNTLHTLGESLKYIKSIYSDTPS